MGVAFRWKSGKKAPLNILEISSAGAGFIDYDADGWPYIVLVGPEGCAVFRNERGQRFRNVTHEVGLDRLAGRWHGCAAQPFPAAQQTMNARDQDIQFEGFHQVIVGAR